MRSRGGRLGLTAIALTVGATLTHVEAPAHADEDARPDIVVILTDDHRFDDLGRMPNVLSLIRDRGASFSKAYVSNSLCCPSRATLLTGKYSHGTGVYTNDSERSGGWPAFQPNENDTIATRLQAAGYTTALIGKYMNLYSGEVVPPGWDRWRAFSSIPSGGAYYDYALVDEALTVTTFGSAPQDYSTDVLGQAAIDTIEGTPAQEPLFLWFAPFAPHGTVRSPPRYDGLFSKARVPHAPSFNEVMSDPPAYLAALPPLTASQVRGQESSRRRGWEALKAVDEWVGAIVQALDTRGRLANTLIVFTSDNGRANGEHRWTYKLTPYRESGKVPLLMRWDGQIPAGVARATVAGNVDIPATILEAAGLAADGMDGVSLLPLARAGTPVRSGLLLEHLAYRAPKPDPVTFCGWQGQRWLYVRYADGFEELYDGRTDPWQLTNLAPGQPPELAFFRDLTRQACQPLPPGMDPF